MKLTMNKAIIILILLASVFLLTSCATKKALREVNFELESTTNNLRQLQYELDDCNLQKSKLETNLSAEREKSNTIISSKDVTIVDLKGQIEDLKKQRTQQYEQVGELTVLSKSASDNMNQTIKQLEQKDSYIRRLLNAKDKADSLNLALAINLKSVLKKGIDDEDIEVKVDKTVVYINLSDKMLFESGSYRLTPRANEVLQKVAQIIASKPELDLMVEGYTDNVPIKNSCMEDNWDLSVKRSASVVRILQKEFGVDPNKLIAAGRGEYNALESNDTVEGKSTNRRTRIILLPKLGQFYDLLKPENQTIVKK